MQFFSNNDCIGVCSRTDNCMTQEIESGIRLQTFINA